MKKILEFLKGLNQNNNKEWFNANRALYQECRDKMLYCTEILISEIRKFDSDMPMLDPKECLFRIFRDVRFSNDKRPYKTNMGSFIARGGRKSARAGYYFHIEPGACFISGGIYMPPAEPLKAVRQAIFDNPEEYLALAANNKFREIFTVFYGDQLKTAPKGFPKDSDYTKLILPKSYAYGHQIDDSVVAAPDYIQYTAGIFRELFEVNRFLNEAIEKYF